MLTSLLAVALAVAIVCLFAVSRAYGDMKLRAETAEAKALEVSQIAVRQAIVAHTLERAPGWFGMHES